MVVDNDEAGGAQEEAAAHAARAQAFAAYLRERIIDWQFTARTWVTSATAVGNMVGVSDVTANDWLRGKKIPRREHCVRIAQVFGAPAAEALSAAGYPVERGDANDAPVMDAERTD